MSKLQWNVQCTFRVVLTAAALISTLPLIPPRPYAGWWWYYWWPDLLPLHGSTVTAGTVTVLSSSVLVSARNGTQAVQQQWETVISGHCWLLRGHRSWRINHEYVGHSVTDSFCTEQNCFDIKWSMSNSPLSYHFQFCCVVLVGIKYLMISIM